MANEPHKLILLPNRTYQAVARSEIKKIAKSVDFSKKRLAELEIVAAEITSNIVKHTTNGGEILVKVLEEPRGIELISIDNGPGMDSVVKMMEDGMSTTNTMGQGLGAIKRFSDEFDMYSLKGWGTILLSRIYVRKPDAFKKKIIEMGVVMLSKEGETVCGDNYDYSIKGNHLKFALSDGLGHGNAADIAARQSLQAFKANLNMPPNEQIRIINTAIKKTRGAVINVTHFDFNNKQMAYCGVGNISSKLLSLRRSKACISYNGIVGHSIPGTINDHVLQWLKTDILVMHSDGLSSRWDIQKYPLITTHSCSIIAAALYKDNYRKTDDVTVAVICQHNRTT